MPQENGSHGFTGQQIDPCLSLNIRMQISFLEAVRQIVFVPHCARGLETSTEYIIWLCWPEKSNKQHNESVTLDPFKCEGVRIGETGFVLP